jgi:hypothetical protein
MRRGHYTPPEPPKKPRLVRVFDPTEIAALKASQGDLDVPCIYHHDSSGAITFVDADELRAWREARLQHTSAAEQK